MISSTNRMWEFSKSFCTELFNLHMCKMRMFVYYNVKRAVNKNPNFSYLSTTHKIYTNKLNKSVFTKLNLNELWIVYKMNSIHTNKILKNNLLYYTRRYSLSVPCKIHTISINTWPLIWNAFPHSCVRLNLSTIMFHYERKVQFNLYLSTGQTHRHIVWSTLTVQYKVNFDQYLSIGLKCFSV